MTNESLVPIHASEAPIRAKPSVYPPMLAARVKGREKRALGDLFGLTNFGVNLTRLPPGEASSLRHAHAKQDEFIYVRTYAKVFQQGKAPKTVHRVRRGA